MLNIVGDINLTDAAFDTGIGVGSKMKDGKDPFEKINRANDDLWIGNFEGVCSDVTDAQGMEAQQFNIPPKYLNHFTHMNFYNMANNHIMEHGAKAFCETAKNLSSFGAKAFGLNNQKSVIFEHCDHKYSISGFCQRKENSVYSPLYWYNPDIQDIKKEFDTLPLDAFKIIYIHWGVEFMDRPTNDQQIFAHALIDMGFDLVIGMHPHLLQGFEDYKGKRIYYSIGNFVFNMGWESLSTMELLSI